MSDDDGQAESQLDFADTDQAEAEASGSGDDENINETDAMDPDVPSDGDEDRSPAAQRERIIAIALGMMQEPAIAAKLRDSVGLRRGWEKLQEIFATAAPAFVAAPGWEKILKQSTVVGDGGIPHWCGIFALYALILAGADVGEWKVGSGISAVRNIKPLRSTPQRGDIAYLAAKNHHCLIKEVHDDGTVDTINGNSGPNSEILIHEKQSIKSFDSFYTVF